MATQAVLAALTLVLFSCSHGRAPVSSENGPTAEPEARVYRTVGSDTLEAYVFRPSATRGGAPRAAIVLFHGGGWSFGDAEWAFPRAREFAALGMVAIAVQYRLSDQAAITPLDAVADARSAIGWVRQNADSLGIDPQRVAAYGWSAGAHLATSAAIFDDDPQGRSTPDALVLVSPAVALEEDEWFAKLVGGAAAVQDVNPIAHVRRGLPPTVILQGDSDTVTPLPAVREFCERLQALGNVCELHVFADVGHLFTPAGVPDDGEPHPDPKTQAEALSRARAFLAGLGYIP